VVVQTIAIAAQTKTDLADLINSALEELVRQRMEPPAFSTLLQAAHRVRTVIHRRTFAQITRALTDTLRVQIDALFVVPTEARTSPWHDLKQDPDRPTLTELKHLLDRLTQVTTFALDAQCYVQRRCRLLSRLWRADRSFFGSISMRIALWAVSGWMIGIRPPSSSIGHRTPLGWPAGASCIE
jgi:hypothetical protein